MVNTTINTDRFLFLKKSLCVLEIVRLKRIVKINNETINENELVDDINEELINLKENFTIPSITFRKGVSAINLEEFYYSFKEILNFNKNNISNKQLQERHIYRLPNLKEMFSLMAKEHEEKHGNWTDIRHSISGLINEAQYMLDALKSFVEYRESDITLFIAIYYLNALEVIDWMFSLSEDGDDVFTKISIPDDVKEDDDE